MNRQEMILLLPLLVDAWIDDTIFFGCSGFSFENNSNSQIDDGLMTLVKSLCPLVKLTRHLTVYNTDSLWSPLPDG